MATPSFRGGSQSRTRNLEIPDAQLRISFVLRSRNDD